MQSTAANAQNETVRILRLLHHRTESHAGLRISLFSPSVQIKKSKGTVKHLCSIAAYHTIFVRKSQVCAVTPIGNAVLLSVKLHFWSYYTIVGASISQTINHAHTRLCFTFILPFYALFVEAEHTLQTRQRPLFPLAADRHRIDPACALVFHQRIILRAGKLRTERTACLAGAAQA